MKKIITLLVILVSVMIACSQTTYKREGNTFSKTKTESTVTSEATDYLWTDCRGNKHIIYITSNGSCYIKKKSEKTGKVYKQYLPKEVSIKICEELGREYKSKTKSA